MRSERQAAGQPLGSLAVYGPTNTAAGSPRFWFRKCCTPDQDCAQCGYCPQIRKRVEAKDRVRDNLRAQRQAGHPAAEISAGAVG